MTITIIIIAITCAVSFLAFNSYVTMTRLILWPPAVLVSDTFDQFP